MQTALRLPDCNNRTWLRCHICRSVHAFMSLVQTSLWIPAFVVRIAAATSPQNVPNFTAARPLRICPAVCKCSSLTTKVLLHFFFIFTTETRQHTSCTLLDVLARTSWSSMIFCTSPWKSLQVGHAAVQDNASHLLLPRSRERIHLTFEQASIAQRGFNLPSISTNPHTRLFFNRGRFTILLAISCP